MIKIISSFFRRKTDENNQKSTLDKLEELTRTIVDSKSKPTGPPPVLSHNSTVFLDNALFR